MSASTNSGSKLSGHTFTINMNGKSSNKSPMGIKYGTWYFLSYKSGKNKKEGKLNIWLPVNENISYAFNHNYKDLDFFGVQTAVDKIQTSALGGEIRRWAGGSVHVSGSAIYQDSNTHTFTVNSKVFSGKGTGELLHLSEALRYLTHGNYSSAEAKVRELINDAGKYADKKLDTNLGSELSKKGGAVLDTIKDEVQLGLIKHPGRWDIRVVSYADNGKSNIVSSMKNMLCTGMNLTFNSPWIGKDPQTLDLKLDFRYAFKSFAESMKFNGEMD
jgi:hypothetical protein